MRLAGWVGAHERGRAGVPRGGRASRRERVKARLSLGAVHGRIALFDGVSRGERRRLPFAAPAAARSPPMRGGRGRVDGMAGREREGSLPGRGAGVKRPALGGCNGGWNTPCQDKPVSGVARSYSAYLAGRRKRPKRNKVTAGIEGDDSHAFCSATSRAERHKLTEGKAGESA